MCVNVESLEMSQKSELTTGGRGSDARFCHEQAEKTPPILPTGRSAKCGIRRVVPADHEAPGQQMQATAAGVTRRHDVKQPRGDWLGQPRYTIWQGGATEHETSDNVQNVGLKPYETRPLHVSGARAVAAPVPRTGRAGTRTPKQQRLIHKQQAERGEALWKEHE